MGLPESRDYTAAPGEEVRSDSYNNVQDAIVGHETRLNDVESRLRDKTRTIDIGVCGLKPDDPDDWELDPDSGGDGSSGGLCLKRLAASGTSRWVRADVQLDAGDKISGYKIYLLEPDVDPEDNRTRAHIQRVIMSTGVSGEFADDPVITLSVAGPGMTFILGSTGAGARAIGTRYSIAIDTRFIGVSLFGIDVDITRD